MLHLFLLAFELGGNIARVTLGQNAMVVSTGDAQMRGLGGGLAHGGTSGIVEDLVVRESLETDGGSRAGVSVMANVRRGSGTRGKTVLVGSGSL